MKDCIIYYKQNCTCKEEGICFEDKGNCEFMVTKDKCKDCTEGIIKCYSCNSKEKEK